MTKSAQKKVMQAIQLHNYGGPEQLILTQIPIPEPKENQVLIRIHAAGINPYEWKFREGYFKEVHPVKLPVTPGIEAAGTVASIGAGVTKFKVGQEVYGHVMGSYAEYSISTENQIFHKPSQLSFEEASAIPVGTQTAWSVLFDISMLKTGEKVLIHGGAGSVGLFAVQLAKWKGAYIIATASGDNVGFVRSLGANMVIDYQTTRFENTVQDVDIVIDTIGENIQNRSFKVLKKGGILVSIVSQPSLEKAAIYSVRAIMRSGGVSTEGLKQIELLVNNGIIKPEIRTTFSLAEASKAQELSRRGHGRGKIVLKIVD